MRQYGLPRLHWRTSFGQAARPATLFGRLTAWPEWQEMACNGGDLMPDLVDGWTIFRRPVTPY